jgi:hypothetical protein
MGAPLAFQVAHAMFRTDSNVGDMVVVLLVVLKQTIWSEFEVGVSTNIIWR